MARGQNPQIIFKNLGRITAGYGDKTDEEKFHGGVDVANVQGTPIPAMTNGVVTKVEGGHKPGDNNFGNTVEIRDNNFNTQQYHHLKDINVQEGQQVQPGQQVATMGATGATYSPSGLGDGTHLDFRIVSKYNQYINPMTYLKKVGSSQPDGSGGPGRKANIIFVRHGTTKLNSNDKIRGWSDPPLDSKGLNEADNLGKKFENSKPDIIITSDLTRAQETAKAISKHTKVPITEVTKDLRPWDVGIATGQSVDKVLPLLKKHAEETPSIPIPEGESFNTFKKRFLGKVIDIQKKYPGKSVVIVAHHRNDRTLAGWEAKGMPKNMDIDLKQFLQKGIEPATSRIIKNS